MPEWSFDTKIIKIKLLSSRKKSIFKITEKVFRLQHDGWKGSHFKVSSHSTKPSTINFSNFYRTII